MTIELDGVNNTLKTDKIEPQSGTALQVGASGDTITLPSGATLNIAGTISNSGTATGFGAIDWQTSDIKTSTFSAVAGKGYFVNTTGGAITVNLPAGSAGAQIALVDYAGTWDSNACTISANGSEKIQGSTDDATLEREREAVQLIYVDSTQGWLVESVTDQGAPQKAYITATGGTITTSGDYKIHTFTGDGTFNVTAIGNSAGGGATTSYVVVAGGGSGGTTNPGGPAGGGGAGGFREGAVPSDPYYPARSPLAATSGLTVSVAPYTITVGAGGTANSSPGRHYGGSGGTSTFSTISSAGGGGGGASCSSNPPTAGRPGGSGGGGGFGPGPAAVGGSGNTPPVSPPQGNNGGAGEDSGTVSGGGGGGAGGAGTTAVYPGTPGQGGNGIASSITGSPVTRAGGGGGGSESQPAGPGGPGGGGAGRFHPSGPGPDAGSTNTGGGGGGAYCGTGGNGGPGVVIIRYKYQN